LSGLDRHCVGSARRAVLAFPALELALPLSHLGRCQSGDASGGLLASLLPLVVRRPLAEIRRAAVHANRDERAAPDWGMARLHRPSSVSFSDAVAHSVAATPGIRGKTVATCRVGDRRRAACTCARTATSTTRTAARRRGAHSTARRRAGCRAGVAAIRRILAANLTSRGPSCLRRSGHSPQ
jgi:hypothetical protein